MPESSSDPTPKTLPARCWALGLVLPAVFVAGVAGVAQGETQVSGEGTYEARMALIRQS